MKLSQYHWHKVPALIGLCGSIGAGKSTVAKALVWQLGYWRVPFAAPLKSMMYAIGLEDEHLNGDQKEQPLDLLCGKTPRQAMQWLGTEWGRNLIGEDFWVKAWERELTSPRIVTDDARFENEFEAIRRNGGVLIRVVRPGLTTSVFAGHSSETAWQNVTPDATLINDGTIEELETKALALVKDLANGAHLPQPMKVDA